MAKHALFFLITLFFINVCATMPAKANDGWAVSENLRARLVPVVFDEADDGVALEKALLEIRLSQGWHTYWHVPGDSGLPPRFDWTGSENVKEVNIAWPAPERHVEFDLQTFGYSGEINFPLSVTLEDKAKPAILDLKMDIMVCKEICIPDHLQMRAVLKASEETHTTHNRRMYDFNMQRVPSMEDSPNLKIDTVTLGPDALVINVFSKKGFNRSDVFPVVDDKTALSAVPEITISSDDRRKAMIKVAKPYDVEDLSSWMAGKSLSITFVSEREAIVQNFTF